MPSDKITLGPNSEGPWPCQGTPRGERLRSRKAVGRRPYLGLSSNTASVEALKMILSRAAKGRMKMWGLDISTAFLFANIVQPTVIELPSNFCLESGEPAYLVLQKALYGLRSASLSWQRHLSRIMVDLGQALSPQRLGPAWQNLGVHHRPCLRG